MEDVSTEALLYTVAGLALLALTLQPALSRYKLVNIPLLYVLAGAGLAALGLPAIDPRAGEIPAEVVEHASELIVIISLAGAGLAIDTPAGWKSWQPTWRLLAVTMPLTMLAIGGLAWGWLGLELPGALLLAAALAPTDPVLARTVQVSPPGEEEQPMAVALTAEAGLNDGLAFPFVYLAISFAQEGAAGAWLAEWAGVDLVYRVAAGVLGGWLVGKAMTWLAFSSHGDANNGAWNAIVMVLAGTLLSYGLVELISGYGFLAVFVCARAARATGETGYARFVHHGADQLESILLALLLLWFGLFLGAGGLAGLRWQEAALAAALVLLIRPLAGLLALHGSDYPGLERRKVAFFGIRGMGSIFYIAYALNHASFADADALWRLTALAICASIFAHGFSSKFLAPDDEPEHPHRDRAVTPDAAR